MTSCSSFLCGVLVITLIRFAFSCLLLVDLVESIILSVAKKRFWTTHLHTGMFGMWWPAFDQERASVFKTTTRQRFACPIFKVWFYAWFQIHFLMHWIQQFGGQIYVPIDLDTICEFHFAPKCVNGVWSFQYILVNLYYCSQFWNPCERSVRNLCDIDTLSELCDDSPKC